MKPISKALRAAKQIPSGKRNAAKKKAVHKWALAVKEMLKGECQ